MRNAAFTVHPIAGTVGAELLGIDLSDALSDETVQAVRQALLDHGVIFFRDQTLPPERFLALAKRFGTPIEYPFVKGLEGFPEIIAVAKLAHETVNFGGVWHSDTTYLEAPPMGTLLVAREVPEGRRGYHVRPTSTLPTKPCRLGMKRLLDGLVAVSSSAKADVTRTREDRVKSDGTEAARKPLSAEHPVVRTHPETGRKALYVNTAHTAHFVGMTEAESAPLLNFLFRHQIQPEFTCRSAGARARWRSGTIAACSIIR